MSSSMRPHRQQPTRLLRPRDSPSKNTGVCCHFLLQCTMQAKSLQSCPTLCDPMNSSPPGSSVHRILQARTLERVAIFFSSRAHDYPANSPWARPSGSSLTPHPCDNCLQPLLQVTCCKAASAVPVSSRPLSCGGARCCGGVSCRVSPHPEGSWGPRGGDGEAGGLVEPTLSLSRCVHSTAPTPLGV